MQRCNRLKDQLTALLKQRSTVERLTEEKDGVQTPRRCHQTLLSSSHSKFSQRHKHELESQHEDLREGYETAAHRVAMLTHVLHRSRHEEALLRAELRHRKEVLVRGD